MNKKIILSILFPLLLSGCFFILHIIFPVLSILIVYHWVVYLCSAISIFMILTLGIDIVSIIKKEPIKLMVLMVIILIVCEIITIGFAELITAPVMIIWSSVEIWKSTNKMRERAVLLLLNPILHFSILIFGFAAELWFSDYKFGRL